MEIQALTPTAGNVVTREERNVLVFLALGIVLGSWPERAPEAGTEASAAAPVETETVPLFPIDLNSASPELLAELPGIGPSKARAIVERRETAGPFRSVDDLDDVRGIGSKTVERLRELVTVDRPEGAGNRERRQLGEQPTRSSPRRERDRLGRAARPGAEPAQVER